MAKYSFFKGFLKLITFIAIFHMSVSNLQCSEPEIRIHYLGHSAFVLQFDNDITIVTDYGHYNAWVQWGWDSPIHDIGDLVPDVMTYSHHHEDHYDPDRIPDGVSHILTGMDCLTIDGIEIKPVRTCEDNIHVESNTSYIFTYKGLKICHLGDAQAQIMAIESNKDVRNHIDTIFPDTFDLLFMTIEGQQKFIPQAEAFVDLLQPRRVIPIHFWSQAYREDFLDYLRTQNDSGKKYQIQKSDSAKYDLFVSESIDSIKVISLKRAPFSQSTYVEMQSGLPFNFQLHQNHPNPFNLSTRIPYSIPNSDFVTLKIYDMLGREIQTVVSEFQKAGTYSINFDAGKLPSGIYFYELQLNNSFLDTKKLFLMR